MTTPQVPARLLPFTALLIAVLMLTSCFVERPVRIADVKRRPGCYEDTSLVLGGSLSTTGTHVPFTNDLVLRDLTDGRDTIAALVRDTFPVGRRIRIPVRVHSAGFLGLLIGGPVVMVADDSVRSRKSTTTRY